MSKTLEGRERGLSGVARKVLNVVPIERPWDVTSILSKMRLEGCVASRHVIAGCLEYLVDEGLVRRTSPQHYVRAPLKKRELKVVERDSERKVVHEQKERAVLAQDDSSPIASLGSVAEGIRALSKEIAAAADRVEEAALKIQSDIDDYSEKLKRFDQLKALLSALREDK